MATTSALTVRWHVVGGGVCAYAPDTAISTTVAAQADENSDCHCRKAFLIFIDFFLMETD
jgi:hypothetical protein